MRIAVYCGTRNIYKDMIPSIKSLLINSNVQKIYLIIEDDIFPYELPKQCECINVSNQQFFPEYGVNYNTRCTWMCMMRTALSKLLPEADIVLSLDADAIVDRDISELWNINLDNYYYAGVREPMKSYMGNGYFTPIYLNGGVLLCNLKKLREDKKDDEIIFTLNTTKYDCAEQDVINKLCQGKLLDLPFEYNDNNYTKHVKDPKIVHYAAIVNWNHLELVKKYRDIPWSEIRKNKK